MFTQVTGFEAGFPATHAPCVSTHQSTQFEALMVMNQRTINIWDTYLGLGKKSFRHIRPLKGLLVIFSEG